MIVTSDKAEARAVTDGNTILATVEVTMPPERVFRALVSDEVERWWGSAHTYRLEPIAIGTRVTVRHDGLGGLRAAADQHAEGWERVLGWHGDYSRREGAADRRRARGQ